MAFGIAVSCPGVALLESDLNFWKNRNKELLGNDLEAAAQLQGQVFQVIAGNRTLESLDDLIQTSKDAPWFKHIWVPNPNEIQIDPKLNYSPIPHFRSVKQPMLILQGKKDNIIPSNSSELISEALNGAKNTQYDVKLLPNANHSMYDVGKSDFPYWAKLHPAYFHTIIDWIGNL